MSDYIKREDAKRAIRRNFHDIETRCMINNIINEVAKVSSDNLVEVVRCKDYKHLDKGENDSESWCECTRIFGTYFDVSEDDFCSYGERKDEGL